MQLTSSFRQSYSKSFDTHCPLGPALLLSNPSGRWGGDDNTYAEKGSYRDGSGLLLQTYLNGKLMQNTSTSDMIFDVARIISFISVGA